MHSRDVIQIAKDYVFEVFAEEGVADVRLEEIEHDVREGVWNVTVGMTRPLGSGALGGILARSAELRGEPAGPRIYRVVRLRDDTGEVLSLKIREYAH